MEARCASYLKVPGREWHQRRRAPAGIWNGDLREGSERLLNWFCDMPNVIVAAIRWSRSEN